MTEKPTLKVGDKIKAEFENYLDQLIVVTGIVRRIDGPDTIVGNDVSDGVPFFVNLNEILEINDVAVPQEIMQSLKEVS